MMEIPSFSDLFSLLAPAPRPQSGLPEGGASGTAPQTPQQTDTVTLSGLPTNHAAASYGDIRSMEDAAPGTVAIAEDGTYSPTAQTTRLSMSFGFEFNLSIQRQATTIRQPASESGDITSIAREIAARMYQSGQVSYGGNLGSSFSETRRFQTELFFSRTRDLSVRLDPKAAQRLDATSQRVARTFELNISLEVSFLSQFTQQSEGISDLDADLFDRYLRHTDGLFGQSGEAMQAFFDDVGRILEGTEQFALDALGSFLQDAAETMGLTDEEVGALQDVAADQIMSFFDEVDGFLAEARAAYGLETPAPQDELAAPTAEPVPAAEPVAAAETDGETADPAEIASPEPVPA